MAPPAEIMNKFALFEIMQYLKEERNVTVKEMIDLINEYWLEENSRYYCTLDAKW